MQFHLKINPHTISQFNAEELSIEKGNDFNWGENELMITGPDMHTQVVMIRSNSKSGWLIGDPIIEKKETTLIEKYLEESDYSNLLQLINGHYRLVVFDKKNHSISVTSSLFGILPVYYHDSGEMIYISTEIKSLSEETQQTQVNKRFILENILFYYPLFNQTAYRSIQLLPAHEVLQISGKGTRLIKHTHIADWFVPQPKHWKKSTEETASLFIDRVKYYLPDEPYVHSLTAGFDSRSLVSCGIHYQKDFETYGFGNEFSDDTRIAGQLAAAADLKFNLISLNRDYVINQSLENGLEFIANANGNAGFARAHYLFSCKTLSNKYRYMVTGNFGSEIFRAAHIAGAVVSNNLYHLFNAATIDDALASIEASEEFQWINKRSFEKEWQELKSDISNLPVFNRDYSGISQNQKFYLFVFEEVFRKYFGTEMVNQSQYLNNRTPFLDTQFLKGVFKTGLAGIYSDYFENNPIKRFKGQVLYAHFMSKTYPAYGKIMTDKGYRPNDLLTATGKLHIIKSYLKKRLRTKYPESDPNAVSESFAYNKLFFQKQLNDSGIFNTPKMMNALGAEQPAHHFLIALSQAWYLNHLAKQTKSKTDLCYQ